ncbi:hypothetical protein CEXT_388031 [Caerostris extrusa]|uniref:Ty3-gypsy retrotransposon protein n=1 Tax=Caerostris extrusa TaxID=172846 RepID=A0AAV4NWR2_CAEEX|nr:hypothetical protein CEXT_388031 [Caerostris extrusa]
MKEAQIADCVSIAKHIELETTTQERKPSQDGRPSKIQNGNSPPTYIIKSDIGEIEAEIMNLIKEMHHLKQLERQSRHSCALREKRDSEGYHRHLVFKNHRKLTKIPRELKKEDGMRVQ